MGDGNTVGERAGTSGTGAALSVLILDDQPIIRYGIAQLLTSQPGMRVAGATDSCSTAWERLETARPDLLLMDVELREGCAYTLILESGESRYPGAGVLGEGA